MELATIVLVAFNGLLTILIGLIVYTYRRDISINEKEHNNMTKRLLQIEVHIDEYEDKRDKQCGEHSRSIGDMKIQIENRKSDIQALKENLTIQLTYMKESQDRIEKEMKKSFDTIFDILNSKIHKQ